MVITTVLLLKCALYLILTILVSQLISLLVEFSEWMKVFRKVFSAIPGPKEWPLFGHAYIFWGNQADIWKTLRMLAKIYPLRYKLRLYKTVTLNIVSAEDTEALLGNTKQLSKSVVYTLLMPWLKTGLLTSTGEKWKTRRKILTPAFHFSILKQFYHIFNENSKIAMKRLENECDKEWSDVTTFVTDYALHSLCETTMGINFSYENKEFGKYKSALMRYGEITTIRLCRPWIRRKSIFKFYPLCQDLERQIKILHQFTSDVIDARLERWENDNDINNNNNAESPTGKKMYAMLDLLIAEMKNGGTIDKKGIQEEVDTFMFEGHDTTSVAMSFAAMVLANNKDAQIKIVEELHQVVGKNSEHITLENVQMLTYLEMCIKESLRLYPSVPFISRKLDVPLKLNDGSEIPAGCVCNIHIQDIHRDPKFWPEPDKFIPERFSPENSLKRNPYSYIPFSAGSRNCIGQKFAMLEMKMFFAHLFLNYELEAVDTPDTIEYLADLVIRTKEPIRVKFRKRLL